MKILLKEAIKAIHFKYLLNNEKAFIFELYHQLRLLEFQQVTEVTWDQGKWRIFYPNRILNDPLLKRYIFHQENTLTDNGYPHLLFETKINYTPTSLKNGVSKLAFDCKRRPEYTQGVMLIVSPKRNLFVEVPDIKEFLTHFPMIEIWILQDHEIEVVSAIV
jgi:hypothetical protein